MENFKKFLKEDNEEDGKKSPPAVIKYTVYGEESDDKYAEYEYEFDVIKNKDNLKDEHKIDPKTYENPIQLKNMVKELSDEGKLELDPMIDFDGLRVNVAPTLKKSLKDGKTLKKVIDMWAELHGYEITDTDDEA